VHTPSCFRTPFADLFGAVVQHRTSSRYVHACSPLSFRSFIFRPSCSLILSSAPPPWPRLIPRLGLRRIAARLALRDCIVQESGSAAASSDPRRLSHRLLLHVFIMPGTLFFRKASVCSFFLSFSSTHCPVLFYLYHLPPWLVCFSAAPALVLGSSCCVCMRPWFAPTTSDCIVLCLLRCFCDPKMLCAPHPLYGNPCCFTLARFCSVSGLVCPSRACVEPAYGVSGTF